MPISAAVIFRIDIKDGRARLITTIQEYMIIDKGGILSAMAGDISGKRKIIKPEKVYPFVNTGVGLSKRAGAKAYCACCMYMIAMKNQLDIAINSGITGGDLEDW